MSYSLDDGFPKSTPQNPEKNFSSFDLKAALKQLGPVKKFDTIKYAELARS